MKVKLLHVEEFVLKAGKGSLLGDSTQYTVTEVMLGTDDGPEGVHTDQHVLGVMSRSRHGRVTWHGVEVDKFLPGIDLEAFCKEVEWYFAQEGNLNWMVYKHRSV